MKISEVAIKRSITTLMLVLVIILLGTVSLSKLSIDLLPDVDFPYAVVSTSYEGAGPQEIENLVTRPLEGVLETVSNIKKVDSISSNGSSVVMLEFNDGTDMDFATLEIREKIDLIKGMLPDDSDEPIVLKINPNMLPIMEIGVTGTDDISKLTTMINERIANRLERIEGVASVSVNGGKENEIKVILLPEKLKGYGLTTSQVVQTLAAENMNLPGGEVKQGNQTLLLRTLGKFDSVEQIKDLPIASANGIVYLRDIATIDEGFKDQKSYTFINGKESIGLSIQKQSNANTVLVSRKINSELKKLKEDLEDVNFNIIYDNAAYIQSSVNNVASTAIIGSILAILVLYIFLRDIKSTLVVGISIPVSIIATFVLLYFAGLTINVVSLGGLALGVGMLVDNSIVVLENIYRHRENGENAIVASSNGASEVGMAVTASTLTTIAVFLPIVFVEGIAAKMFKDMSLTVTFSLLASLLVALTFVPMMASKLLKNHSKKSSIKNGVFSGILNKIGNGMEKIDKKYRELLEKAITHRKSTILIVAAVFIVTLSLIPVVGMELMPKFDEGQFQIAVELPHGTVIEETSEVVSQIENKLINISEIKQVSVKLGGSESVMDSTPKTNTATITVDVGSVKERRRSTDSIIDEVRQLTKYIPGADISFQSLSSMGSSLGGKPVVVEIYGDDMEELERISKDVVNMIKNVKGTREVASSIKEGVPEAQIRIDRNKASMYGVNIASVANTVRTAVKGQTATKYNINGSEIDIKVMYTPSKVEYMNDIQSIYVISQSGVKVPISEIADIKYEKGPVTLNRSNQKRVVTVEAELYKRDLNSVTKDITAQFDNYSMPPGYSYDMGGQQKEMAKSFESLKLALIMAIILVYMILASQFESLIHPLTIMFSVPLAITGAIAALFITGRTLNMPSFIGIIMLAGIVVNNAIVFVDYINTLREEGMSRREAILTAGPTRLRPIMMTTLTTVLAMFPMALGIGEGSEMQAPLATAVIGGLLLSTFLTLVIIPVIYSIFDDISMKIKHVKQV